MAKAEMDMIRDILDWPVPTERKLELIRQIAGREPQRQAAAAEAPATARKAKPRKRAMATRRSTLWKELKQVAPDKAAKTQYGSVTADDIQKLLDESRRGSEQAGQTQ